MQASARICGRSAADSVIQNVGQSQVVRSIHFNHHSHGNWTNYYIILGPRDKDAPPTSQQINKFPPGEASEVRSDAVSHYFSFFLIHRRALRTQPIRAKVRQIGRIFPEHVERSFSVDPEYIIVAVRRILPTIFAKQKFAQLRTSYIRRILPTMFANKCSPS